MPLLHLNRHWVRRSAHAVLGGLVVLWCIGQFARDETLLTAWCFYIPSPLVGAALLAAATIEATSRRWWWTTVAVCLATPPLYFVSVIENSFVARPRATAPAQARLLHWNVAGGRLGWPAIEEHLTAQSAEIYVLSEAPGDDALDAFVEKLGTDYDHCRAAKFAVFARGKLKHQTLIETTKGLDLLSLTWEREGAELSLLVVDHVSDPLVARNPSLRKLNDHISLTQPDLIVGDFNAPRRSIALSRLPTGYAHAYHSVGSGLGYTWPLPLPIYSLDHCIVGPKITPATYKLRSTGRSDHRLQIFGFTVGHAVPQ